MKSVLPLISIVIPAHNAAEFLDECLSSVVAQTYQNIEIIVVDDDSIDNTKNIIQKYEAKDSRIKYLYVDKHNAAQTRRKGVEHSSASLVCFADSDDILHSEYVEALYKAMEKTGSKIATGKVMNIASSQDININLNETSNIHTETDLLAFFGSNYHSNESSKYIAQGICAKLFTKDLFEHVDYSVLKTSILEDNYIVVQLLNKIVPNELAMIDKTIYYYRQNPKSTMGTVLDHLIQYGSSEITYPKLFEVTMDYINGIFHGKKDVESYINKIKAEEYYSLAEVVVDRNMRFHSQEKQIIGMQEHITELEADIENSNRKIQDLLNSQTYKVGRAVTYPLRTLKHRIKK